MGLWLFPMIFSLALWLTWLLRRYALLRNVLDVPNQRSSHTQPTPRGGGLAIVLGFSLAMLVLFFSDLLSLPHLLAFMGGGGLVAAVGFIDDHRPLAARWRLVAHFMAAALGLIGLGGIPALQVFGSTFELGWIGCVLAAFYLVWVLNLYNFMDGIDGIAGVEAVTVSLSGALLYWLLGQSAAVLLPALLAAASAGFLFWNFPPARIFMGDAGSGYLGLILGLLALQAGFVEPSLLWSWLILLGVFIVDATLTLVRRLGRGEKVYEAHRSHAYQHASRRYGRHLPVTLGVLAINIFWLLPIACWVALGGEGVVGILLAYTPLVWLALRFKAGVAG